MDSPPNGSTSLEYKGDDRLIVGIVLAVAIRGEIRGTRIARRIAGNSRGGGRLDNLLSQLPWNGVLDAVRELLDAYRWIDSLESVSVRGSGKARVCCAWDHSCRVMYVVLLTVIRITDNI